MLLFPLALLYALIQMRGQPLAGGQVAGSASLPLERAAGGDTPVLTLQSARGPLRLLLDTGASTTMVTPELADRWQLASTPLSPRHFALAGGGSGCGQLQPRRTLLPALTLAGEPSGGRLRLRGLEALVLPVSALPAGVDGVLGAPTLRRLPIWVDPLAQRIALGAAALRQRQAIRSQRIPAERYSLRWQRGVPVLDLQTPQGTVAALADTGAEGLFISPSLAARLTSQGAPQPLRLVGVCGEQRVERRRYSGLALIPDPRPLIDPLRVRPGALIPSPIPASAPGPRSPVRGQVPPAEGSHRPDLTASVSDAIITANPIFAGLGVEAIVGQEWLRQRRQLWRLDLNPPQLELH